ncbi:transposase [Polaribacter litorisediminis]|uniref:transposase n=1 Tax=Polaribacter litorisediminis TaxID=1908341 RepID=UPI001CBB0240|nr:transposase [Polaribacter litorisediminis]UAM98896.1 transposase [Polaribacter litorisediminis]
MSKIRRISEFQHEFPFLSASENFQLYFNQFLLGDLGKIYLAIPWDDLVSVFKIKESVKGTKNYFSPKGKIALIFLKHYACCSDKKLIEQLNANIDYQFFCDLHLGHHRLTNYKIVSQIRCELAQNLAIEKVEKTLFNHWSSFIKEQSAVFTDATCYESEVRYPTNQKLLWESVHWSHHQMKIICKIASLKLPRTKYLKWKKRYISYSKMRRKTNKKRVPLTRSLLHLLKKINKILDNLEKQYDLELPCNYYKRRATIKKISVQQELLFTKGEKPKNRIVSIDKDYLRPIVRGKEIKKVEFGAKVNKLQIDGINFIQRISFDNFNEGTQFKNTIYKAQGLTKTKVRIVGADAIYATNKNRVFATSNNIQTDFKPKGKPSKHRKQQLQLAKMITKERATRLEGSFGKEKEHYHLKKIKAKTKKTEILWIFFGIHTANCLEVGRRMQKKILEKVA